MKTSPQKLAYIKSWAEKNKEKVRASKLAWAEKNKDFDKKRSKLPERKSLKLKVSRAKNDRSRKLATLSRQPWDVTDDAWLMDSVGKLTEKEMAKHLGRSVKAVETRLWRLRRENES